MGQAPNTPGGHLVLVRMESGERKVLLTNTVYPLHASKREPKPRFRLKGKTTPDFILKAIQAWFVQAQVDARSPPGGECSIGHGLLHGFFQTLEQVAEARTREVAPKRLQVSGQSEQGRMGSRFPSSSIDVAAEKVITMKECLDSLRVAFASGGEERGFEEIRSGSVSWGLGVTSEGQVGCHCPTGEEGLVRYLNRFIAQRADGFEWTSVSVFLNEGFWVPKQMLGNGDHDVWLVALGEFKGGGLWIEDDSGKGPVVIRDSGGVEKTGHVKVIHESPARVHSGLEFGMGSWTGGELWIIKAWVDHRETESPLADKFHLEDLRFVTHGLRIGQRAEGGLNRGTNLSAISKFKADGVSRAPVANQEVTEGIASEEGLELWHVEFPHEVVDGEWVEGAVALSEAMSFACKEHVKQLCTIEEGDEVQVGLEALSSSLQQRSWHEELLTRCQPEEESSVLLRSLSVEVPLSEALTTAPEQFLQTRTISLEEARRELSMWYEPGREEVEALEVTTEAVERVTSREVDSWIEEGKQVVQVPGKAVLTRKSGVGKRRLRAVCSGNHMPSPASSNEKAELYAGGIDALTVRVVLSYTAQFEDWTVCVLDIKTAFLNAPARTSSTEGNSGPIIVVRPPYLLVQMGILRADHRWRVRRALYGLQTSPRDWAVYRDKELRALKIPSVEDATLMQSQTDDSMWLLRTVAGQTVAVMIVYVDDIAVFGPRDMTERVSAAILARWKTSTPIWPSKDQSVSFCGMEVAKSTKGWRVAQERYMKELLKRYEVTGVATSPMPKWEEPELEEGTIEQVREAQAITGAILWSVTRTRPDLMFVASRMSQYSTKSPKAVVGWGMHALKYVASTLRLGLDYVTDPGPPFGSRNQLALPRTEGTLELYSDASHAPNGSRSVQCTIATWRSSIIAWESTRQPFITLSSAEAELVSMVHSVQVADSILPVIEELLQRDVVTALMADNSAALASFGPGAGSWRNRHLRMRAAAARERVEAGILSAHYIPGDLQVADVGTKALGSSKLLGLLEMVNVRIPVDLSADALALKAFGRNYGKVERHSNSTLSAAELVLAALACLPGAKAQPVDSGVEFRMWLRWVFFWVVCGVLWWWNRALKLDRETSPNSVLGESSAAEALDSPRNRNEPASSSTCARIETQLIDREVSRGRSSAAEAPDHTSRGRDGAPSDQRGLGNESAPRQSPGQEGNEEVCVFPIVGRTDWRSNWVPAHFLRYLLSVAGDKIFGILGLGLVEIWRCRALGRTFRYGVAYAYEKARGTGPLGAEGGQRLLYDISQEHLNRGPEPEEDEVPEDTAIDEVRHIFQEEGPGYRPFNLGVVVERYSTAIPSQRRRATLPPAPAPFAV